MIDKDEDGDDQWHPKLREHAAYGKRFCEGCPVKQTCLDWAVAYDIREGTWGGKDQWEREKERKERNSS